MIGTQETMNYKNNVQWTTMTMNNSNNINIMATITIQQCTMTTMNIALNGLQ